MKNTIRKLSSLGFTKYEALVYTTLLSVGRAMSVREIWLESRVPRTKIYPTVRRLKKRGLVEILPEKPIMVKPSSPEVLAPNVQVLKKRLRNMQRALSDLKKLYEISKTQDNLEKREVWIVKKPSEVDHKLDDMLQRAEEEIFAILNYNGIKTLLTTCKKTLRSAFFENVKITVLTKAIKENVNYLRELSNFAEIKHLENMPMTNLFVIDRRETLFFKQNLINSVGYVDGVLGIFANDSDISKSLRELFYYDKGKEPENVNVVLPLIENKVMSEEELRLSGSSLWVKMFFYTFYSWLYSKFGKTEAQKRLKELGKEIVQTFLSNGLNFIIDSDFQGSLKNLSHLFMHEEKVNIRFKLDMQLKTLTCKIKAPLDTSYALSAADEFDVPPSVWGITLLGLLDYFGYDSKPLRSEFNKNKGAWIIQRRLL